LVQTFNFWRKTPNHKRITPLASKRPFLVLKNIAPLNQASKKST